MENWEYLNKYLKQCKAEGLRPKTIKMSEHILKHFLSWYGDKSLNDLTDDDIYNYLDFLDSYTYKRKGLKCCYSEATKQHNRIIIRKFVTSFNPNLGKIIKIKTIKNDKLPESLFTPDEIEKLINACQSERDRAMISTFYESGARKGELLSVKLKHVTFDEYGCIMNIPKGKTGSRRIRLVYSASFLRQWIECHPLKDNREALLFCSLHSPFNAISDAGMFLQLRTLGGKAGIPADKLYWHNFRHTRATELAQKLTEAQLKEYLGWVQSSQMSSVYVHLSGKNIDGAILKMHGIEIKEEEKIKVNRCPRCKEINPDLVLYCGKCGLPLKDEVKAQIEADKAEIDLAIMEAIMINPEILEEIKNRIKHIQ